MNNIFDETVKTLTEDAQSLAKKLHKMQENNDFKGWIEVTRLLKDTLSLIKEYDWHLEYSEYTTKGSIDIKDDGSMNVPSSRLTFTNNQYRQIAVWEQNHNNEIRNHKVWDVIESPKNDIADCKWVKVFEPFINNKQSILYELNYLDNDAEMKHRGTGKTKSIIYLAQKYSIPILASENTKKLYKSENVNIYSNIMEITLSGSDIFLVDEGFQDINAVNHILNRKNMNDKIFIGFIQKR